MSVLLRLIVVSTFLGACGSNEPTPTFSVAAHPVEGGVLLSAWSRHDQVIFVGGELSKQPGDDPGGPGIIAIYDADGLCVHEAATPRTLWWIDGTDPDDYFAVGEQGTILHIEGGQVRDESVDTPATLYGVWAGSAQPVAVGGDVWESKTGEIWQRTTEGQWTRTHSLPTVAFKVWGEFVVGDGFAGRLRGASFSPTPLPVPVPLLTVRGRAEDDVWAAGGRSSPVLMHWDGERWTAIPVDTSCASSGLNGVYTAPGEDVWVAGNFGSAARFDGTRWHCERPPVSPDEHLHMAWGHGDEVLFSGGNLFSPGNNHGTIVRWSHDQHALTPVPCPSAHLDLPHGLDALTVDRGQGRGPTSGHRR